MGILRESGSSAIQSMYLQSYNHLKYRGYYQDAETGFYYVSSRYCDPVIGRFINADDIELVLVDSIALTDKNLYAYCDNNLVMRVDQKGEMWELAIAGGGSIAFGSGFSLSAIVAGLSVAAPVAIAAVTTAVVVVGVSEAIKYAKSKSNENTKEVVDPYARPGQKKQGRERKSKARQSKNWTPRSNPKPPKKHTPGRGHRKYK